MSGATGQGVTITLAGASAATTTTAADGTYAFTGLVNGSYTVAPWKQGYTFTPASLSFTVSGGNATGKDFVAAAGGSTAPVLDPGFPVCTGMIVSTASNMVVGPFSTPGPNRVLVATAAWYPPFNDPYPLSFDYPDGTPSGASAFVKRTEPNDGTIHWTAQIWTAVAAEQLTNVRVRNTRSHPGDYSTGIFCVYSYSGVSGIGAVADHHSPMSDVGAGISGQYTVTINAHAANSQIVGISQGGDTYVPFTANAATTIDYQRNDGVGNGEGTDGGAASWHKTTPTSGPGNVTLGCTDSQLAFAVEAIELLAAP